MDSFSKSIPLDETAHSFQDGYDDGSIGQNSYQAEEQKLGMSPLVHCPLNMVSR